jgi:hypothetical protein
VDITNIAATAWSTFVAMVKEGCIHSLARIVDIPYDQPRHIEGELAPVGAVGCRVIVVDLFIARHERA